MHGDMNLHVDVENARKKKDEFKMAGNKEFTAGDFKAAIDSYSEGLALPSSTQDDLGLDLILLANRSAAYLNLGNYAQSLADADGVLKQTPLHPKAIHRKSKSLFGLSRYEEAVHFLEEKSQNLTSSAGLQILQLLSQAKTFYRQQKFGEYNVAELMRTKNKRLDLSDYTGPVEISSELIPASKGRGLIATENISAGQLVLGSKAFDIVFLNFDKVITGKIEIPSTQNYISSSGEVNLVRSIQKLLTSHPEKIRDLSTLYAGPDLALPPVDDSNPDHKIDVRRIQGICSFNCFAYGTEIFQNWGLWLIPSFINHSCVDCNCTWKIFGDFMLVRAFKPIAKGQEILISYLSPDESYEKRRSILTKHKFTCGCRLCVLEEIEPLFQRSQKENLLNKLEVLAKIPHGNMSPLHASCLLEIVAQLDKLGSDCDLDLNFYLTIGLRKLAEWYYGNTNYNEAAVFLERAHGMLDSTVLCRTAVHVAVNIISTHLKLCNLEKSRKWVEILKRNVTIAYGSSVDEIISQVAPNTVQEMKFFGFL